MASLDSSVWEFRKSVTRGRMMNRLTIEQILAAMWQDYLLLNPDAMGIYQLLSSQNTQLTNDHIALRTFNLPRVDISHLARPFINAGYRIAGHYEFPFKHLNAQHFEHPNAQFPKIFISQLLVEQLPESQQEAIHQLVSQIPEQVIMSDTFCYSGRHWPISYDAYQQLATVSDHAAWIYAMGYRPNHFTLLVNTLESHESLEQVNDFLLAQGFKLNSAGGLIKGSPDELLEQSSTPVNAVEISFTDQTVKVPGCYYEFAQRYKTPEGALYQGFIAESAGEVF
ncbi:MAG: DUF1338 domain-containing protein [Amphritea sp.]